MTQKRELSATDALEVIGCLATEVLRLHQGGSAHLEIDSRSVTVDLGARKASLRPPTEAQSRFGGAAPGAEECPPQLRLAQAVQVPRDLAAACRALHEAGIPLIPEQIDLYQLGAFFWRLLSGEAVEALASPHVRAKVAPDVLGLVERALGRHTDHFAGVGEFADAVTHVLQQRRELPFANLGAFTIVERIGRGGMGEVYKGYDPALQRDVAIKVLPSKLAENPDLIKRFHIEATAVARLDHPNVVHIYSISEDRGYHFFAMPFIHGESLAHRLRRSGRMDVEESLDIIEQVLQGLQAAHEQGLVHRDIKPSNILLDARNKRVLIADFGLVKYLKTPGDLTHTGVVVGTVDYLSPEQGQGHAVDSRADLYAVGVMLFRMLAGRLPFQAADGMPMIFQHAFVQPPRLSEIAPDLPEPLVSMVAKLLAKAPGERYQTAQELLEEIRLLRARRILRTEAAGASETPLLPHGVLQRAGGAAGVPSTIDMPVLPPSPPPGITPPGKPFRKYVLAAGTVLAAVLLLWLSPVRDFAARWFVSPTEQPGGPGKRPTPPLPPGPQTAPDLLAARWLLELGGRGTILSRGGPQEVAVMADLPEEPFQLATINLFENPQLTDAELAKLPSLENLTELILGKTSITDAGVKALPQLPNLKTLHLGRIEATPARIKLTDATLAELKRFPTITVLNLDGAALTDDGLRLLAHLSHLEQLLLAKTSIGDGGLSHLPTHTGLIFLGLSDTNITDTGLTFLGALKNLTHLQLAKTRVTDGGLKSLSQLPSLKQVDLHNTKLVTEAGINALKKAIPECDVRYP